MKNTSIKLVAGLVLLAGSLGLQAQTWPTQPIKIIVPFTPGTGMDTIARVVGPRLSERLGQPVIVQNTPGASGNIGADAVAKSNPDGHTLLMGANTMLMASQIYKNVPFDPVKDFSPVSLAAWGTLMLVANPKTGLRTMPELVAAAKAKPGSVTFGSPGVGTPHHMAMELFKARTGLFMLHVPYRGTAGYTHDLLARRDHGGLPAGAHRAGLREGRQAERAGRGQPQAPPGGARTWPPSSELGVKDVEVDLWYAFFAPAKTPAPVVSQLNTEIAAIMQACPKSDVLGRPAWTLRPPPPTSSPHWSPRTTRAGAR